MQCLAHCDAHGPDAPLDLEDFAGDAGWSADEAAFVRRRVQAALQHWAEINQEIAAASRNWELRRIAAPDRAVLRLAIAEMLYADDTPARVAIDEAIELARTYGAAESPQFVNGVLDAVYRKQRKPDCGASDPA